MDFKRLEETLKFRLDVFFGTYYTIFKGKYAMKFMCLLQAAAVHASVPHGVRRPMAEHQ